MTWSRWARYDTARKLAERMAPIHISVTRAFFHSGLRNAGTPFEMASTPVTAAPPEANARRTMNTLTAATPGESPPVASGRPIGRAWRWPAITWYRPALHVSPRLTMNTYVGTAKIRPDSRTASRFPYAISQTKKSETPIRTGAERG